MVVPPRTIVLAILRIAIRHFRKSCKWNYDFWLNRENFGAALYRRRSRSSLPQNERRFIILGLPLASAIDAVNRRRIEFQSFRIDRLATLSTQPEFVIIDAL